MKSLLILCLLHLSIAQIDDGRIFSPVCASVLRPDGVSDQMVPICEGDEPDPPNTSAFRPISGICPGVTFDFPRAIQVTDQAQYRSYFPALNEGTICFWFNMATNHNQAFMGLFSYAVDARDNEILLRIDGAFSLSYHLRGSIRSRFNLPRVAEHQVHVCGFFSSRTQTAGIYINGTRQTVVSYPDGPTAGGGRLLLGQEQDIGFTLDQNRAFNGNISDVMVWPRVLSDDEIEGIARHCKCPLDYSVAMTMDRVELVGDARYRVEPECMIL